MSLLDQIFGGGKQTQDLPLPSPFDCTCGYHLCPVHGRIGLVNPIYGPLPGPPALLTREMVAAIESADRCGLGIIAACIGTSDFVRPPDTHCTQCGSTYVAQAVDRASCPHCGSDTGLFGEEIESGEEA